jgi:hypothetical protein
MLFADERTERIVVNEQTPPDELLKVTVNVIGAAVVVVVVVVGAAVVVVVVVVGAAVVVVVVGAEVVVVVVGAAVVVVVVVVVGIPDMLNVNELVHAPTDVIVTCVAESETVTLLPANSSALVAVDGTTEPTFAVRLKFGPKSPPIPLYNVIVVIIFHF